MIFSIEDPKYATKKLLELITNLSSVAGYKINVQKSLTFVYSNNEWPEKGIINKYHSQ